jgi:adenine-specific DNA-methyltransferase
VEPEEATAEHPEAPAGRAPGPSRSATGSSKARGRAEAEPSGGPSSLPVTGRLLLGDNLRWLQELRKDPSVAGEVRLVYIDPPFGTGQTFAEERRPGSVAYADTLRGGAFLEFLRRRLQALHDLMAEDGSIYVHIDHKVGHRVRVLMDEVFGEDRFVNEITRVKCNPKNFARQAYGNVKDLLLFYSRSPRRVWNESREPMPAEDVLRLFPKLDASGRRYTTTPLHAPGVTRNGPTGRPWKGQAPPEGRHWRYDPEVLTRLDQDGRIEWSSTRNPRLRVYADELAPRGKKRQDIWEFKDPAYPAYPTEKNLEMLRTIVAASSNPGDLVLDAFCGSGTTLVAAQALHRRWIGIDASAAAVEVARQRLAKDSGQFPPVERLGADAPEPRP